MIFDILLYTSLTICIIGICHRVYFWIKKSPSVLPSRSPGRLTGTARKFAKTVFSTRVISLVQAFFIDILLLRRSLKASLLGWTMHMLIFWGFIALVLMHAMDSLFTESLFPYYYSTVNPFFFLRSLFGLMVLAGIGIAIYRRYFKRNQRLNNAGSDLALILLISAIILSGVLLEGMKMASVKEFTVMVEDYAGLSYEDEDVIALEALWVKEYGLVSSRISAPFDPDMISLGLEVHESSCLDCHSPNKSAFLGYAAAKLLSPVALLFDRLHMTDVFYYLHIILCFSGLALVPFGKMSHVVAVPTKLLTRSVSDSQQPYEDMRLAHQMLALWACTHCGTCNLHCSAGLIRETIPNDFILPSEKMQALKKAVQKNQVDKETLLALFQGITLCTGCDRCTVVCPSGIHLKSLWLDAKEHLAMMHAEHPLVRTGFSFSRKIIAIGPGQKNAPSGTKESSIAPRISPVDRSGSMAIDSAENHSDELPIPVPIQTFSHCFGCQNCSTICPVAAQYDTPEKDLTLLPHQIMYTLGLGLTNMAQETAMVWNCLSCYQCQEHCPQNVSVCDILFLLKNQTFNQFKGIQT